MQAPVAPQIPQDCDASQSCSAAEAVPAGVSAKPSAENAPLTGEIIVYTDGGCSGNPGAGGWGCVIIDEKAAERGIAPKVTELSGGEKSTTNNRMELTAVISALSAIAQSSANALRPVSVFTDSQYVKNGITSWIKGWKRNGWRNAKNEPVKNQDLWLALDALCARLAVRWVWVKGHAGVHYNEIVDQLCQKEIQNLRQQNV